MMNIRRIASFLRWRIVAIRYVTMILNMRWQRLFKTSYARTAIAAEVEKLGYCYSPKPIDLGIIHQIQSIYSPRGATVEPKNNGSPFVNLFYKEDIQPANPVLQLAFSPHILEIASDYFNGKLILDSVQVLYSYSTGNTIRESQYWHLDYGARKSFHAIIYLNDVATSDDGPFGFVDKAATKQVGRSIILRRISDAQFLKEHKAKNTIEFFGKAGSMVYVDPSSCYHYGSRCKDSRLAIFVTFSSWFPFSQPIELVNQNRAQLFAAASSIRPDLSAEFLKSMLQL